MCILWHDVCSKVLVECRNGRARYGGIEEACELCINRGGNKAG